MRALADCRLYGILDTGYIPPRQAVSVVQAMLDGGIDILQLRSKSASHDQMVSLGEKILPLTRAAGIPLIINDHPAVAGEIEAEGVHIGQDDGSLEEARLLAGDGAIVGRSTHSVAQARAAVAEGADYIGFGPLFATPTKPDYPPIGTADIRVVHEEHPTVPIFCIGGITPGNLAAVLAAGARRVVIVSAILQAPDVAAMVAGLKKTLAGTP
ncbi:MAG TPA: thiamine phosphate synthase [Verrucomicrobiales bacterium]|nr:thiamine phosphate synthase [Verrucomicrobiae bacterium]MCP5554757.1 thiamine phosphate synthase [Akkermansiaceae bacterium]HRX54224.1 thiamine phosphate synthase [Verrucomicrobiales bacterium]